MPTIYSASSSQWPLLQRKTEQKFKSGLFNVSAEFIRPVGNTDLPTVIETSIGAVDVWPEPTVSSGTDGFERINATGYGQWVGPGAGESTLSEMTWGYKKGTIDVAGWALYADGRGYESNHYLTNSFGCFFDTVVVKKIGTTLPAVPSRDPSKSGLRIYDTNLVDITERLFELSLFFAPIPRPALPGTWSPLTFTGNFDPKPIVSGPAHKTSINQTKYGAIMETEVIYDVGYAHIDYGQFNIIPPPP